MRETLFNWLGPRMAGARCLDLFAGSGALGLESLSRGAAHVTFVESEAAAARELSARLSEWGAEAARVRVEIGDAVRFLQGGFGRGDDRGAGGRVASGDGRGIGGSGADGDGCGGGGGDGRGIGGGNGRGIGGGDERGIGGAFDIVFLDPPFESDLLRVTAGLLEERQWLAPGALIYAECAARIGLPSLPPGWTATRTKQAGEVGYHLLTRA